MPRLTELFTREELPENARPVHDYIIKTRGKIANSYAVMFHAPQLVDRVVRLATNLRFESSLSRTTLELIALTVCAEHDNSYEIDVHTPSALQAGIAAQTIAALHAKSDVPNQDLESAMCIDCSRELIRTKTLSNESFARLSASLNPTGVVEFVGAVGFYSMLSLMQNALQVRPQAS